MITGTVTDKFSHQAGAMSTATFDFILKGTPAISDENMDAWMEYMFHQRPKPANAKGVEVALETIDPNGNLIQIVALQLVILMAITGSHLLLKYLEHTR